jgi:hypothetical protein
LYANAGEDLDAKLIRSGREINDELSLCSAMRPFSEIPLYHSSIDIFAVRVVAG